MSISDHLFYKIHYLKNKSKFEKNTLRHHLNIHSSSLNFHYLMMAVLSFIKRCYSSWFSFLFSIDYVWDNCSLQHPRNFLFNTWTLFFVWYVKMCWISVTVLWKFFNLLIFHCKKNEYLKFLIYHYLDLYNVQVQTKT